MEHLTFEQLSSDANGFDEAVLRSPGIDHFCSSSMWILPASEHLMAPGQPWIRRSNGSYVALACTDSSAGTRVLHPLEAMWALGSPLVGAYPHELAELLISSLAADGSWDAVVLTGIAEDSTLWKTLVPALGRRYVLTRGPVTRRYVADLSGGEQAFLAKRSPGFRKNLRKAERRARQLELSFEVADDGALEDVDASFERLLAIERRSWKGRRGVGIDTEPMSTFYRAMNRRLVERGARRLVFATIDGNDAAFIFGGVLGNTYRGLQFSFDDAYTEHSLGNLCQLAEIRRLSDDGVLVYDLGTELTYKKRWGERVFATSCLIVHSS
jgi:CelD/BcsL family acetyltransferase involved in cellulose biosynthesis